VGHRLWVGVWNADRHQIRVDNNFFHYYLGAKYPELGYLTFYENVSLALQDPTEQKLPYRDLRNSENETDRTLHYLRLIRRYLLPGNIVDSK
jgi:hypothetical protein